MSRELKSPAYTEVLLPLTSDDLPLSPPRSPQWRPDPEADAPAKHEPSHRASRIFRRVGSELLITLCLALWCIAVTFLCALVFGGIGVAILKRGHYRDPGPYIQASRGDGTLAVLIGSTVLGSGIGVCAHLLWTLTHLRDEPIELGSEFGGHPLAVVVTVLAVIAGGFASAVGVVLHPQHLVPLGYTVAMALKVYGIGLGLIVGVIGGVLLFLLLAVSVCGS